MPTLTALSQTKLPTAPAASNPPLPSNPAYVHPLPTNPVFQASINEAHDFVAATVETGCSNFDVKAAIASADKVSYQAQVLASTDLGEDTENPFKAAHHKDFVVSDGQEFENIHSVAPLLPITVGKGDTHTYIDPSGATILLRETKAMMVRKRKVVDGVMKAKSRAVIRGDLVLEQFPELYTDMKTYSPTCSIKTLTAVLNFASAGNFDVYTWDAKNAFCQSKMTPPRYFLRVPAALRAQPHIMMKLFDMPLAEVQKVDGMVIGAYLYGLVESARVWYDTLTNALATLGFKAHPLLRGFLFRMGIDNPTEVTFVPIWVDDLTITSNTEGVALSVGMFLSAKFKSPPPERILRNGIATTYVSINIRWMVHPLDGSLHLQLDQSNYARKVVAKSGILSTSTRDALRCLPKSASLSRLDKDNVSVYSQDDDEVHLLEDEFGFRYREMVGSCIHLLHTRHDLRFPVILMATHSNLPGRAHFLYMVHFMKYLSHHTDEPLALTSKTESKYNLAAHKLGLPGTNTALIPVLTYDLPIDPDCTPREPLHGLQLWGATDAEHKGSTTGKATYCNTLLLGTAVFMSATCIPLRVSPSTTQAEAIGANRNAQRLNFWSVALNTCGLDFPPIPNNELPTDFLLTRPAPPAHILAIDNKSVVDVATNAKGILTVNAAEHIALNLQALTQLTFDKVITVLWAATGRNFSDHGTKVLDMLLNAVHSASLQNRPLSATTWGPIVQFATSSTFKSSINSHASDNKTSSRTTLTSHANTITDDKNIAASKPTKHLTKEHYRALSSYFMYKGN